MTENNQNEPITFNGIPRLDVPDNQSTSLHDLDDQLSRAKKNREFIQKEVEARGGVVIPFNLSESNKINFSGIPTSLKDLPSDVNGELSLSNVELTNLPKTIEGDFDINQTSSYVDSKFSAEFHKEFIKDALALKKNISDEKKTLLTSESLEKIKSLRESSVSKISNENKPN